MFIINYNDNPINVDSFFEALTYRYIADLNDIDAIERSILLFLCRKTLGFQKLQDTLGRSYLSHKLSIGIATLDRKTKILIDKGYIYRISSKGGITKDVTKKYSMYRLGNKILTETLDYWIEIKDSNGFRY